MTTKQPLS